MAKHQISIMIEDRPGLETKAARQGITLSLYIRHALDFYAGLDDLVLANIRHQIKDSKFPIEAAFENFAISTFARFEAAGELGLGNEFSIPEFELASNEKGEPSYRGMELFKVLKLKYKEQLKKLSK